MKKIILLFLIWRIVITLAAGFGVKLLPLQTGFLATKPHIFNENPRLWSFANFDGSHYLSIAAVGYQQFQQAFFPLYPTLIHNLGVFFRLNYITVGLFISHLSMLFGLYFIYKLLRFDYDERNSYWIVLFLLFFPTSFYFTSVYTESLFLFLSVSCFYAARKKWWFLAGATGGLASATRLVGVFLFPAIVIDYYLSSRVLRLRSGQAPSRDLLQIKVGEKDSSTPPPWAGSVGMTTRWLWIFLIPIGLFLYMYWLKQNYGDPWYFFHSQPFFGAQRSGGNLILLPQVFWRYLKILFTSDFTYQYFIAAVEFITAIIFFLLSLLAFKYLRLSYAVFSFLSLLTPTLTGTFSSLPRYVLTAFPLFFFLPVLVKNDKGKLMILSVSIVLLAVFTILFTRGYWIA